jgi:flagellar motor switch protein FliN/FliY
MENTIATQSSTSLENAAQNPLRLINRLELPLTICFGSAELPLRDVLALVPGASVELDRKIEDPVDLLINGTLVARGELAMVDGAFGIRITQII